LHLDLHRFVATTATLELELYLLAISAVCVLRLAADIDPYLVARERNGDLRILEARVLELPPEVVLDLDGRSARADSIRGSTRADEFRPPRARSFARAIKIAFTLAREAIGEYTSKRQPPSFAITFTPSACNDSFRPVAIPSSSASLD
jgi:hypothetical protein